MIVQVLIQNMQTFVAFWFKFACSDATKIKNNQSSDTYMSKTKIKGL